ncbi:fumarylacetoacetate hydrolase family protein [Rhodococcus sp. OK302]|uniref:fumarylacetoacetate hydrolase family protein n=1 Tax=Rhodococcus sp. OK302 TaxID=1882769 RepID=UPI000B93CB53|nr:fumarylacetoacetate hydrolase family protein [Rhodococcus sp. OK302]OYD70994.1 2-keto-4-pentenoate hydratase/2-oxohepta-3-ene-1,7-dioic acid hydratase in catechol pathway [Rhodococcus sp. OK302]
MKFANYDQRAVVTDGHRAVYVADASAGEFADDPQQIFARWTEFAAWAATVDVADGFVIDPSKLGAPSPKPQQVFAVGLNYAAHARESGIDVPPEPAVFTKFPTSVVGPDSDLDLPTDTVDYEAELVVIIGQPTHRVSESDAWDHIAGITVGQDISERTRQRVGPAAQFSLGKSFPGFAPTGPWLTTIDEVPDPNNLGIGCSINGTVMQKARTDDLIFSVPIIVAKLSEILPLLPGDLIFTGTPSGVGGARTPPVFLRDGDVLETWVEGIGTITSRCRAGIPYPSPRNA